jgi:polar amino acid transport system permease protein
MISASLIVEALPALARGAGTTLYISAGAGIAALMVGAALGALRTSRFAVLRAAALLYIDIMRGIPLLVLILIAFYVLPSSGLMLDPAATGIAALAAYYAAYVAEVIRGALQAIPGGQREAAMMIGMTRAQIVWRVVLPQALGLMLPPLGGLLIGLVKESALLSVISVTELTFEAKQAVSRTYAPFEIYAVAALGYWALTSLVEFTARWMEHRATQHRPASADHGGHQ